VEIPVDRVGDVSVATVPVEELDADNALAFTHAVAPVLEANSKVVLDLSRMRFLDSSGLGAFLGCLHTMEARGGKTPDLARKAVWAHVLAYNLVRTVMAQAAARHGVELRSVSFKGAVQTLQAFQPVIAARGEHDAVFRLRVYGQILDTVATHRAGDPPDRFEPRLRKLRPKHYAFSGSRATRSNARS
jgi:anti-anti-sigma factor